jgi:hypothetical protein
LDGVTESKKALGKPFVMALTLRRMIQMEMKTRTSTASLLLSHLQSRSTSRFAKKMLMLSLTVKSMH